MPPKQKADKQQPKISEAWKKKPAVPKTSGNRSSLAAALNPSKPAPRSTTTAATSSPKATQAKLGTPAQSGTPSHPPSSLAGTPAASGTRAGHDGPLAGTQASPGRISTTRHAGKALQAITEEPMQTPKHRKRSGDSAQDEKISPSDRHSEKTHRTVEGMEIQATSDQTMSPLVNEGESQNLAQAPTTRKMEGAQDLFTAFDTALDRKAQLQAESRNLVVRTEAYLSSRECPSTTEQKATPKPEGQGQEATQGARRNRES